MIEVRQEAGPFDFAKVGAVLRVFFFLILLQVLAGAASASESVRVRIESRLGAVKISGLSLRFPGHSGGVSGFQSLLVQFKKSKGRLYDWSVTERNTGELIAKFRSRSFEISGSLLRSGLNPVPDRVSIHPVGSVKSDLIATVDVEEYLRGVLPMEMPSTWPLEALKAQAVAARTFALYRKAERMRVHAPYDLESDVMDQVFRHGNVLSDDQNAKIGLAVDETRGVVLKTAMNRIFAAYFHADCGGQTEDAQSVWAGEAPTGTTVDSACPLRSLWQARLSRDEIVKRLARADSQFAVFANKKLASLAPLSRTASGRIDLMRAVWSDGSESKISGHVFRMAVGHDVIKSTKFEMDLSDPSEISFKGSGFGHGVGLCQWGARQMALEGKTHGQILAHYYPNAVLAALTALR